jgi:hypothetical protein
MLARFSSQRLGRNFCLGKRKVSKLKVYQNQALLFLNCHDLSTKGFQPACEQSRLAKNKNGSHRGDGRFLAEPMSTCGRSG